ncbi:MAG: hypothetical protein DMG62_21975 [Acidobacteria bacterium]|nr:MAG: hypothetical protein DMG62_21975 [Acidobacteriota bacterium]
MFARNCYTAFLFWKILPIRESIAIALELQAPKDIAVPGKHTAGAAGSPLFIYLVFRSAAHPRACVFVSAAFALANC